MGGRGNGNTHSRHVHFADEDIDIQNLRAFGVYRKGMNHENWWLRPHGRRLQEFMQGLPVGDQRRFFISLNDADTQQQIYEEKKLMKRKSEGNQWKKVGGGRFS